MLSYSRLFIFCALLISFVSAQNCNSIFENNTKDSNYWYGFSIIDINRKTKIKKISEDALISSIKNLSLSIYSNIVANETQTIIDQVDNKKTNFSNKFISNISVSTQISGIEYEIVSQGKCDKQYYSLVRLKKSSFKSRENIRYASLINKSDDLSESSFSNLFDYLKYINELYEDFDSLLIGIFEPSYQSKIDSRKNNLKNNYYNAISTIKPIYSYSLPYSQYDNRPNNLEISFKSNFTNLPLNSGNISLKSLGKSDKYYFNSSGKILFNLNNSIRNKKIAEIEILLNLNELLYDHKLYKVKKIENPKYDFIISKQPLVFHYEDNFFDEKLSNSIFKYLKVNIFSKENVNLEINPNAPYKIEIEASDVIKNFNEQTKQYIYILRDINFKIVDIVTNQQVFIVNKDSLKGVSFQSFDKAAKRIEKDLKFINQEIRDELFNKILTL